MNAECDLTISIVNYNSMEYLTSCLESIYSNPPGVSFEVIVIENASRDQDSAVQPIKAKFPQVKLIVNPVNRYFTGGHNQALAQSRGRYFLILNPDTLIPPGTLSTLVEFLDIHPQVGAATCQERDAHGNLVITSARFPSPLVEVIEWTWLRNRVGNAILSKYRMLNWDRMSSRRIDVGTGCFILARTDLLQTFGGFDEKIRLYFSEYDLYWKIAQQGFQAYYLSDAHYVHFGQRSTSKEQQASIRKIYFDDMFQYYREHFGWLRANGMRVSIRLGRFAERLAYYVWLPRGLNFVKRKLGKLGLA
jgi:GT2 family glycosyltransferase